jgi:hypothetical protein
MTTREIRTVPVQEVFRTAQAIVGRRLATRETWPLEMLVSQAGVKEPLDRVGLRILETVQQFTELPVGRLRPTDHFADIFRVQMTELAQHGIGAVRGRNLGEHVDTFVYEWLEAAEACSTARGWRLQRLTLPKPPRKEDEWLDAIMEMTVAEFLRFFSATGAR